MKSTWLTEMRFTCTTEPCLKLYRGYVISSLLYIVLSKYNVCAAIRISFFHFNLNQQFICVERIETLHAHIDIVRPPTDGAHDSTVFFRRDLFYFSPAF